MEVKNTCIAVSLLVIQSSTQFPFTVWLIQLEKTWIHHGSTSNIERIPLGVGRFIDRVTQ